MPKASSVRVPMCHLSRVPGSAGRKTMTHAAVWICEYPYRTMRIAGPSSDCAGCPVWQEIESQRRRNARANEEVRMLEAMVAS